MIQIGKFLVISMKSIVSLKEIDTFKRSAETLINKIVLDTKTSAVLGHTYKFFDHYWSKISLVCRWHALPFRKYPT